MKKKGFTLIELLAIIVILAIIALIAVPVVLNIIDKAKKSAIVRRGEFYADAVQKSVMTEILSAGNQVYFDECALTADKTLNCDGKEITVDLGGDLPSEGSVVYFKEGKVDRVTLYYDDNIVIKNSDSKFYLGDINNISDTHIALLESQIKEAYGKDIKIGDYVDYDETKGGTVTVDEEDVRWRVLGIEDGKLLLVSNKTVGKNIKEVSTEEDAVYDLTGFELDGSDLYEYLEEQTSPYGYGEGALKARSITVEDINKITGYNPNRTGDGSYELKFHNGRKTEYGNEMTYFLTVGTNEKDLLNWNSKINPENNNNSYLVNTFLLPDGTKLAFNDNEANKEKKEITLKSNYYWYNPQTLIKEEIVGEYNKVGIKEKTNPAYQMLFEGVDNGENSYWLGSTYVFTNGENVWFGLRSVMQPGTDGNFYDPVVGYGSRLWHSNSNGDTIKAYINKTKEYEKRCRAVVVLKSDVTLTKSGDNTWTIE